MTKEQFSELVSQYERLVYTVCFQLVRDASAAEDLTQETFLSAWLHRGSLPQGYERQWLGRIAANKAKDHLKSAYVRRVQLAREDQEGMESGPGPAAPDLESAPDDLYIVSEGAENIRAIIRSLHEPYLKVSVLYFLEEKSVDEIAQALGRPRKTVQTQLYRAKLTLQKIIKEGARP